MNRQRILAITGQILQERRKKLKIIQEDLAKKVGCSTSVLSKIESGSYELKYFTFISICEALNLEPDKTLRKAIDLDPLYLKSYKKFSSTLSEDVKKDIESYVVFDFNTPQLAKSSKRD